MRARFGLTVCPVIPFPAVGGADKRTLRLLEAMERAGIVPWIVSATDAAGAAALRERGWRVDAVADARSTVAARVRQHLARRPSPYIPALAERLGAAAPAAALVQVEHTMSAYYGRAVRCLPSILSLHNIDSELLSSIAQSTSPLSLHGLRMRNRASAMRAVERRALPRHDLVLVVSEHDAEAVASRSRDVLLVPNGVDDELLTLPDAPVEREQVLFFGRYDYEPNEHGMQRFLGEVWPRVAAARPAARLRLVGKGMSSQLREAAMRAERVDVIGLVDDLAAELAACRLVVVPLWQGGGTRLKVLEALAAARPVVGTPLGVEGIGFRDRHHGLLAAAPAPLADAVVALLEDAARAASLGAAGRELARLFRWETVTAPLVERYDRLADATRAA